MTIRIAVLSDIHFAESCAVPERRADIADLLLLRAVHRLNSLVRPDLTLVLGDLLDDGHGVAAESQLRQLRETLQLLQSPTLTIPGNHDGDLGKFQQVFAPAPPWLDLKGVRFVPFLDREEAGYNASRSAVDLERLRQARAGHTGPLVAVQHTSLFPPGRHACPFNYTNADQVIASMRETGTRLALSGHYHPGFDLADQGLRFISAPALCEAPFGFLELVLEGDAVRAVRHDLAMPRGLGLVDEHTHTPFAYCSENMDLEKSAMLAEAFGLAGLVYTEHSGQLYFHAEDYWSGRCAEVGLNGAAATANRAADYLETARRVARSSVRVGFEVDSDRVGNPLLRAEDRRQADRLVGGIHYVPELARPVPRIDRAMAEYLAIQERFVKSGMHILAHPFRVFRRARVAVPETLYAPTIRLLKEQQVAAEINFHTNTPDPVFFRGCLAAGIKLSFGSDAHNLYEVGEFAPHLKFLAELGVRDGLDAVLARTRSVVGC